jgi:pSer/pThr/pTyr-binding forkhead associated (FHA) protein
MGPRPSPAPSVPAQPHPGPLGKPAPAAAKPAAPKPAPPPKGQPLPTPKPMPAVAARQAGPIFGGAAAPPGQEDDDGSQPLEPTAFVEPPDTEVGLSGLRSAMDDDDEFAGAIPDREPMGAETTDVRYRRFVEAAGLGAPQPGPPGSAPQPDPMVFHPPTIPPGEAISASHLFPSVSVEEGKAVERSENLICSKCNSLVHPGHKFCGKCGTPVEEFATKRHPTNLFGPMQQVGKAKLVLIKGEGFDGISYHLNAKEHIAGRSEGAIIFPDDPFLSPRHTNFFYRDGKLFLRDEGSVNGTYVRVRESETMQPGDFFLAGEQIFRFDVLDPYRDDPDPDGTLFFASPPRPSVFRIVQVLTGGKEGLIYNAKRDALVIGRERSDVNFPIDRYMSGSHTKLEVRGPGAWALTDMGSKNGTFLRVRGERELQHGDYVFIGQQLLRVEITAF